MAFKFVGGGSGGSASSVWTAGTGDDIYFNSGSGNVGIGTTAPTADLELRKDAAPELRIRSNTAGSSAYLRFMPRTAGNGNADTYIEATGSASVFQEGDLVVATAGSESMRITSSGNVGIGTTNPSSKLSILDGDIYVRDTTPMLKLEESDSGGNRYEFLVDDNVLRIGRSNVPNSLQLQADGNICGTDGVFEACSSDARLKEDVRDYGTGSLSRLRQLRPVTFTWNDIGVTEYGYVPGQYHTGFLAQEVIDVFPEWVSTDNKAYYTVDDGNLRFVLLRAVQELAAKHDAEVSALKAANDHQRVQIDMLQSERDALNAQLNELRAANDNIRATNDLILRRLDALEDVRKAALP